MNSITENTTKAKTEILDTGVSQIPYEALEAIGKIFKEGELKYGKDNWKKGIGDLEYQEQRLEHAIRHLILYANGEREFCNEPYRLEDHLAKVAWFCVTQIWLRTRN